MTPAANTNARVYDSLRTAHLERAHQQVPARIYYRRRRYDFDEAQATGLDLVQGSTFGLARSLLAGDIRRLEINEPLQRTGLSRSLIAVLAARLAARVHRSPLSVVTYAIENRDPYGPPVPTSAKSRVRRRLDRTLSTLTARQVTRIAYGTGAAAELYRQSLGGQLRTATAATIPALPAACDCGPLDKDAHRVVFLGALTERKGFDRVLQAWPLVTAANSGARLTVVGKGALEDVAREFDAAQPTVELIVDPPREHIHRLLREASTLVLLSQPTATWREQVGLPIVEGLSHGCSIITTTETGIADWLAEHGHTTLDPLADPQTVAGAILESLRENRSAASVLADLPTVDGRLAADRWLFEAADS